MMSSDDESSSMSDASYSRSRKHSSKSDRRKKRSRSDSRRKKSSAEDLEDGASSDHVDQSRKSHKRHKKEKKEVKSGRKKQRKKSRKRYRDGRDSGSSDEDVRDTNGLPSHLVDRHHGLADALCSLFDEFRDMATDLPVLLIRLASGVSFDLSQMTDKGAASRLARVFECLAPFGVEQQWRSATDAAWVWKSPAGPSSTGKDNDLVLIRVVRATLDQIGLTHQAVLDFEGQRVPEHSDPPVDDNYINALVDKGTQKLLDSFASVDLATELAGLCQIILDGEVVATDGLPDERLRTNLESLLVTCGLEKSEMDVEKDDESTAKADLVTTGFGLPEESMEFAQLMIQRVLEVCAKAKAASTSKKRIKGPMPLDHFIENGKGIDSSDDEDGPLPLGESELARAATLSLEQVKVAAARRAKELACAKEGVEFDPELHENVREEWMVVPGKFDFLSSIKSGQPIRTRQFEAKGVPGPRKGGPSPDESIDPATVAEIHAIRNAYEQARGRSLMEEHREAKKVRAVEQQEEKSGSSWEWNRDKDIDAGRRVDTDALNMILGGAGSDLKDKFQRSS